jgi:hypothetical protein
MNSDKHQDYDIIYPIAFVLYDNFTTSEEISKYYEYRSYTMLSSFDNN